MPEQTFYCIDTSALIELKMLYRMKTFPSLWDKLSDLVKQDRLIAPREVLNELEAKDDELFRWFKKHKKMFKAANQDQIDTAKEILTKFPQLVDPNKQIPDADPFVIALAIVRNKERSLFGEKFIVVTREERTGSGGGRPKIPDVCVAYGIECIYGATALAELFEREQWEF